MLRNERSLHLGLLIIALFGSRPDAAAQGRSYGGAQASPDVFSGSLYGPGDIYVKIPSRDEFGRDQLAMFRAWNPDPVGHHEANLRAIHPLLASVVRKTQVDNPGLRFVIGSGRRGGKLQRKAVAWGWSRTEDSPHRLGLAVDLWPLDTDGHVFFGPQTQSRIAAALMKAASDLGVLIRWGGRFHGFKDTDRSHFELRHP
jgi:hypothetical protein